MKKSFRLLGVAFLCMFLINQVFAQPANDDVGGAISLNLGVMGSCDGVNVSATIDFTTATAGPDAVNPSCDSFGTNLDAFYTFVAGATGEIEVSVVAGDDMEMAVFDAAGTEFGCFTNTNAGESETISGLTAGNTYILQVWVDDFNANVVDFCIQEPPPPPPAPANDMCANAIALTVNGDLLCGSVTNGTVESATDSGTDTPPEDNTICFGTEDDDVWFTFVATTADHQIDLINITGGTTDLYHSVWSGACGALTNLNCSDPNSSTLTGLTPGDTYYVRVYSWTGTAGQTSVFDICIGTVPPPPPPPANNDCVDAIDLGTIQPAGACPASIVSLDLTSATASANALDPSCDSFGTNLDAFYSFTAGPEGAIELSVISGDDLEGAVYDACGGIEFGCFGSTDAGGVQTVTGLTAGNAYVLHVWNDDFNANAIDFCLQEPPPPPPFDVCSGAIPLTVGAFCDGTNTNGDNTPALDEGIYDAGCFSGTVNDVWYSFTASDPGLGFVQVSTDYLGGTNTDTEIALWGGPDCDNLTELACSQDEGTVVNFNSIFVTPITAGETFYVQVSGWNGNTGTFCLDVIDVCPDADIDYNVAATTCDMTGATVELQDNNGAVLASAPLGIGGGSGSFGTFACGAYNIVITGAPQCYTQPGGDVGPRLVALEGADVTEEFTNMPEVPTLSQWGLITLALLLSAVGAVTMSASKLALAGTSSVPMPFTNINLPFNAAILRKAMQITGIIALIGFAICFAIFGAIFMSDIIGVAIAGPVFAYLIHVIYMMEKK